MSMSLKVLLVRIIPEPRASGMLAGLSLLPEAIVVTFKIVFLSLIIGKRQLAKVRFEPDVVEFRNEEIASDECSPFPSDHNLVKCSE